MQPDVTSNKVTRSCRDRRRILFDILDTRSDNYVPILLIMVDILPRQGGVPGEVPRTLTVTAEAELPDT